MHRLTIVTLIALVASVLPMARTRADELYQCPPSATPRKCEKLQRAHAANDAERTAEQARDLPYREYGRQHPVQLRLVLTPSLTALGLGNAYAAGMWGGGFGLGVQRELGLVALRGDALFRVGGGEIKSYSDAPEHRATGAILGGELSPALLFRPYPLYAGPMLSGGVLVMKGADLVAHSPALGPPTTRIRVPHVAGFAAVGALVGLVLDPEGRVDVGARACIGLWNGQHLYLSAGLQVAIVLAD